MNRCFGASAQGAEGTSTGMSARSLHMSCATMASAAALVVALIAAGCSALDMRVEDGPSEASAASSELQKSSAVEAMQDRATSPSSRQSASSSGNVQPEAGSSESESPAAELADAPSSESSNSAETLAENQPVVLGDEQFDAYLPLLEGKRAAVFSNQTGIVGDAVSYERTAQGRLDDPGSGVDLVPFGMAPDGTPAEYGQHILDALLAHGVNVTLGFAPEHGFRGTEDAGAAIGDYVDEGTGVSIHSLYGGNAYPSDDALAAFDVLVVDIQDVGLRYYTYYLTMYHLLDACANAGKEVLILDRPNPNGFYVDGPILQDGCTSAVGELPLPVVHGMTLGELAQMINGEGWLAAGPNSCNLTVVPCRNYTHQTKAAIVARPSPNLKDMRAVYLYASLCFFENTAVSVGRGTEHPFEVYGSPYLAGNSAYSFAFTPQSIPGATNPPFLGEECYGVDLRSVPLEQIWSEGINLEYLVSAYHDVASARGDLSFFGEPVGSDLYWIDLLVGTTEVRHLVEAGWSAADIEQTWADDVEAFRSQRSPYLLYAE